MHKKLLLVLTAIAIFGTADAQFGKLLNKAKDKTKQRVDQRIDKEMDKGLDKAEGKKTTTPSSSSGSSSSSESAEEVKPVEENTLKSFAKFDFIPGDSILYAEDFEGEASGELPLGWNTNGTGEVTTFEKIQGQWLRLHKGFTYLPDNDKQFGNNYTAEFDVILRLKTIGWMYPEFRMGIFASGDEETTSNEFLKNYEKNAVAWMVLHPSENNNSKVSLHSQVAHKSHFNSEAKAYEPMEKFYGRPMHISMQVQGERFRMWINGDKVFDAPKAVPAKQVMNQLFFEVSSTNYAEDQYGVYLGNIKVATGKPDTRHKLVEEGKFSTTGILFDFQSAVIKPESYGVVKEIAGVLKENGGIKVKVLGHTSSDGDDKANMELSVKRAAAVKDLLTSEFGIDASRIETEGKGETQPVADNKTKEGKSANRRVEFIKL